MQRFVYSAKDEQTQKIVKSVVQAESEREAAKLLLAQGLSPLTIQEEADGNIISRLTQRITSKDKVTFTRSLATLIEAGLHICGMDGEDLLEDCEEAFGVELATEEDGYMKTFSLAENEYLFTGEGIDFFGICRFMRWVRGIPEPVIRDLTVGELHAALVNAVKEQVKHD